MIEREKWNAENMWRTNSDEYKYLAEINELGTYVKSINETLRNIYSNECFSIQIEEVKDRCNFTEVKKKLIEIEKMVNELQ